MGSTVIRSDKNDLLCCGCKQLVNKLHKGYCTACDKAASYRSAARRLEKINNQYSEWLDKIKDKDFHPLTEDEWLDACKHFEKCAYCATREIEARSMFIGVNEGGRYAAWNVIPACEMCSTALKTTPNPFLRMNNIHNRSTLSSGRKSSSQARRYGFNTTKLKKITDYLDTKM